MLFFLCSFWFCLNVVYFGIRIFVLYIVEFNYDLEIVKMLYLLLIIMFLRRWKFFWDVIECILRWVMDMRCFWFFVVWFLVDLLFWFVVLLLFVFFCVEGLGCGWMFLDRRIRLIVKMFWMLGIVMVVWLCLDYL